MKKKEIIEEIKRKLAAWIPGYNWVEAEKTIESFGELLDKYKKST